MVPGCIIDVLHAHMEARPLLDWDLGLFFLTSEFLPTCGQLFSTLSKKIVSLFDMNQSRESKMVNLTMGIFSIFA